jgi:hypothetical protein
LRPTFGYGWGTPGKICRNKQIQFAEKTRGTNHVRYLLSNNTIRLTTNVPISYVIDEVTFEVEEPLFLLVMPDESLKVPLPELSNNYIEKTIDWWRGWAQNLTVRSNVLNQLISPRFPLNGRIRLSELQ